jgi:membrane protein
MNKIDNAHRTKAAVAWELLRRTAGRWWQHDTFRFSASLAFFTIFSLAPMLLIAVGLTSLFYAREDVIQSIVTEVGGLVGAHGGKVVHDVLEASSGFGKSVWAIATGLATCLLGASAVFAELQTALNRIWAVEANPRRGFILKLLIDRLRSFTIALGVGFILLVSLVMSAAISAAQAYMQTRIPELPVLWQTLNVIISFLITTALFAMIYKFLPDARIGWRDVRVGAAVTAALFTGGKYVIGAYLGHTATASMFGAAGSLAVLLIWVYYSALICFFGAEFTQVYMRWRGAPVVPENHAVPTSAVL